MNTAKLLESLSYQNSCKTRFFAEDYAYSFLSMRGTVKRDVSGNIIALLPGVSEGTLLLDAHIDQIGFVVTHIDEKGFLRVAKSGGVDLSVISGQEVVVWGKTPLRGVISIQPPHLVSEEKKVPDIGDFSIDIGLPKKQAEALVSEGDFITFAMPGKRMKNSRFTAPALDNRAGVASLLLAAESLAGKELPVTVAILLSSGEELGCRGAVTAAFGLEPEACICVDVSFGDSPDTPKTKCGTLGNGPMIGISPILDRDMADTLQKLAKKDNIPCQLEVMGGECGTNADVISNSREGVRTAMLSIPLRNMHTPAEIVHLEDVEKTSELIVSYIRNGGERHA